ncbi:MAG: hypothetical protein ACEQSK_16095 [Sphingomonadaceae bacterium]
MSTTFEVLPFGGGEMEAELERSATRSPRGGGRPRGRGRPAGHLPLRGRQALRRAVPAPWPYYYGTGYGPGWPYPVPAQAPAVPNDDSDEGDDGQDELGGCNCPKCRQRATTFEVMPFG